MFFIQRVLDACGHPWPFLDRQPGNLDTRLCSKSLLLCGRALKVVAECTRVAVLWLFAKRVLALHKLPVFGASGGRFHVLPLWPGWVAKLGHRNRSDTVCFWKGGGAGGIWPTKTLATA